MSSSRHTDKQWEIRRKELVEYIERHGHANVPRKCDDYPSLGSWVYRNRACYRQKKISHVRVAKLVRLGFNFGERNPVKDSDLFELTCGRYGVGNFSSHTDKDALWEMRYAELESYVKDKGDANISRNYEPNLPLGRWVARHRAYFKKGKMSLDRIVKLKLLGFNFSASKSNNSPANEPENLGKAYEQLRASKSIPESGELLTKRYKDLDAHVKEKGNFLEFSFKDEPITNTFSEEANKNTKM